MDLEKFAAASYPQEVQVQKNRLFLDERAEAKHKIHKTYKYCRVMFNSDDGEVALELLTAMVDDGTMVLPFEMKKIAAGPERPSIVMKQFFADIEYVPEGSALRARYQIEIVDDRSFVTFLLPRFFADDLDGAQEDPVADDADGEPEDDGEPPVADLAESDDAALEVEIEMYMGDKGNLTAADVLTHLQSKGAKIRADRLKILLGKMDEVEVMRGGWYRWNKD